MAEAVSTTAPKDSDAAISFSQKLAAIIHSDPARPIIEYKRHVYSKGDYAALGDRVIGLLDDAGIGPRTAVGVIVRNRPLHAAAMLALISNDRYLSSIHAFQSPEAMAQEIGEGRFAAVVADACDWTEPMLAAAKACGTVAIRLNHDPLGQATTEAIRPIPGLEKLGNGSYRRLDGEPGLEILSSGTTGKPKRILFPTRMLVRTVQSVAFALDGDVQPEILAWPYAGISGICNLVASAMLDRYTVILERFNVPEWVEAVERLRPASISGMPTMARMILDAGVPRDRISSVRRFYGGSAPMTPELQDEFERTYGIDIIWAYGATEFCGSAISWTPALYREFRDTKLGSIGRALPDVSLRVVDPDTQEEVPQGREGYLQVKVPAIGEGWIGTTDIVMIDADGFVFHKGRGDGAILRGGHKVLPEKVAERLRMHPAVLDAVVVGLPDARLGALPVAAVELRSGVPAPSPDELRRHAQLGLLAPQVPAKILILPTLPRNSTLKVDLQAVSAAFRQQDASEG